jgi:hypothetical protein
MKTEKRKKNGQNVRETDESVRKWAKTYKNGKPVKKGSKNVRKTDKNVSKPNFELSINGRYDKGLTVQMFVANGR